MRGTRNAVRGNSSWVRIPPPPPKAEASAVVSFADGGGGSPHGSHQRRVVSALLMEAEGLGWVPKCVAVGALLIEAGDRIALNQEGSPGPPARPRLPFAPLLSV